MYEAIRFKKSDDLFLAHHFLIARYYYSFLSAKNVFLCKLFKNINHLYMTIFRFSIHKHRP